MHTYVHLQKLSLLQYFLYLAFTIYIYRAIYYSHDFFCELNSKIVCSRCKRVNFSCNPNESLNLSDLHKNVKFTQLHFPQLWFSYEHSRKWMKAKKPWYTCMVKQYLPIMDFCNFTIKHHLLYLFWMFGRHPSILNKSHRSVGHRRRHDNIGLRDRGKFPSPTDLLGKRCCSLQGGFTIQCNIQECLVSGICSAVQHEAGLSSYSWT